MRPAASAEGGRLAWAEGMDVSVIIATYNRPVSLRVCVRGLCEQARRPEEVVIADDGSGAETAEVIRQVQQEAPFPVRHAWQEDRGFRAAAARNQAVRQSQGEYLIFVDGDLALPPDFVAAHLRAAEPGVVLLGSVLRLEEAPSAAVVAGRLGLGELASLPLPEERRRLARRHRKLRLHARLRRWHLCKPHKPQLAAGNFSLFRQDFAAVNGFDEDFVGWGQEDDDLGRRLMAAGIRPRSVVREAVGYHLYHPATLRPWGEGPNAWKLDRRQVEVHCRNGLVKRSPISPE